MSARAFRPLKRDLAQRRRGADMKRAERGERRPERRKSRGEQPASVIHHSKFIIHNSPPPSSRSGVALVLVLSILVLVASLVVAFMVSSRNELSQTTQYVAGQEALGLAESAVNLVMSQIREATLSGIDASGRGTHAWASQPGALRVWDDKGDFAQLYKLYSAAKMKEDSLNFLSGEIPVAWRGQPDAYVDLNEPVAKRNPGGNATWQYPILDPAALGVVEGFSSNLTQDATVPWDSRTVMPVRWIYISRTGAMSNTLQSDSIGRIAFWTDDETCKVNINTASFTKVSRGAARMAQNISSSFWDTPTTSLAQDYAMGRSMPTQDEYQRYLGHPASVNIGAIMRLDNPASFTQKNAFSLLPRYKWGGSENGMIDWTKAPDFSRPEAERIANKYRKTERLYANIDELLFSPERLLRDSSDYPAVSGQSREQLTNLYRFFITTSSRAPDLNLFGQPRVNLWPIHATNDAYHRTVYDQLIARVGTVGKNKYYFEREKPLDQTYDWSNISRNRGIFSYLQQLTAQEIPGFGGGTLLGKYDAGATGEWNQILTEIFDYIRCVNLNETFAGFDTNIAENYQSYTAELRPRDRPRDSLFDAQLNDPWVNANDHAGAGFVLPIRIDSLGTRGMGRVPTLSQCGYLLLGNKINVPPGEPLQTSLFSWLLLENFSPMEGYMPWVPPQDFTIAIRGTNPLTFQQHDSPQGGFTPPPPQPLYPDITLTKTLFDKWSRPQGSGNGNVLTTGGVVGLTWPNLSGSLENATVASTGDPYPFYTPASKASVFQGKSLNVNGGAFTIEYRIGNKTFQTFQVRFPSVLLPMPLTEDTRVSFSSGITGVRWERSKTVVRSMLLKDGDVRITACLQDVPEEFFAKHPDYDSFDPNDTYPEGDVPENIKVRNAHSFMKRGSIAFGGATFGTLVKSIIEYGSSTDILPGASQLMQTNKNPSISPAIKDLQEQGWTGDWTTGIAHMPDGALVIKSDEGFARGGSQPNYFAELQWALNSGFFSPVRQIPSAVLFGTLPTGVKTTEKAYKTNNDAKAAPWRTLLFCPNPDIGTAHIGLTSPHDSLLLDFFNMPVVEPYAISEPLSTAGRINMNTQILPFTDIQRDSGLYAMFSSQKVTALSATDTFSRNYKTKETLSGTATQTSADTYRYRINIPETLKQFHERFAPGGNGDNGDIFRSASEICSIFLVPNTFVKETGADGTSGLTLNSAGIQWNGTRLSVPTMTNWWKDYRLTGDNLRERPYATIYPLLTTKSNSYTVHVRAQSLAPGTNKVTGEYRGSTTIERYVDPADERIGTDINPDTQSLEPLYRFRVVDTKRFAP